MANYFDNQSKWSWQVSDNRVLVTTDHGSHTHTMDVTNVPIGEMADHTGQVMGDAHRAASHDFKESAELTENMGAIDAGDSSASGSAVDNTGQASTSEAFSDSLSADDESIDGGENCEDGLDI